MGFAQNYETSYPSSSFGYYRGTPYWGGEGSGKGQDVSGSNVFTQGQGPIGNTGWEPSIMYIFIFIIVEMVIFGILAAKL
jgi:hypothetical protein